jgi:hypothetical protein
MLTPTELEDRTREIKSQEKKSKKIKKNRKKIEKKSQKKRKQFLCHFILTVLELLEDFCLSFT